MKVTGSCKVLTKRMTLQKVCIHFCNLFLDRISGGELFERVINDDFILTEKACIMFMRQICEGIAFMHCREVLHLDLKVFTLPFLLNM